MVQGPFRIFPKIHPFWHPDPSLMVKENASTTKKCKEIITARHVACVSSERAFKALKIIVLSVYCVLTDSDAVRKMVCQWSV